MCPMLLNGLSDGPAMVLSPPQEHAFLPFPRQSKFGVAVDANAAASYFGNGFQTHAFSSTGKPAAIAPIAGKPSRKRSREEADFEEARNAPSAPAMPAPAPAAPKEEPIYGEGMVLLNPRTGMALSAESQTGTWYEENLATSAVTASSAPAQQHNMASVTGRKSQRLDPSTPSLDDIALSSMQQQNSGSDDNRRLLDAANRSSPFSGEPLVDDATRLLGISWQRIAMDDADIAAAVRGWKKYIDRQFSAYLVDSEIMMKNRALNAYLVTARPVTSLGPAHNVVFYLFNDELTQAQLVGSTWETCVQNLRSNPVMFEGTQVLSASDRPVVNGAAQNHSVLGMNPADAGLPLLQTLGAQPSFSNGSGAGMTESVGMGGGMEIDA